MNNSRLGQAYTENITEVAFKPFNFTLTKGYDSSNTCFVNIETCTTVGANPIKKRGGSPVHISGEGYKYRCFPKHLVATTKNGFQGYTYPMQISANKWVIFQCFDKDGNRLEKAKEITITVNNGEMCIGERATNFFGNFIHEGEIIKVYGEKFSGLRGLLKMLFNISGAIYQYRDSTPEAPGDQLINGHYYFSTGHIIRPWGEVVNTELSFEEAQTQAKESMGYKLITLLDAVIVEEGYTSTLMFQSDDYLVVYQQAYSHTQRNADDMYFEPMYIPKQPDGRFYFPHLMKEDGYYGATTFNGEFWHDHYYNTKPKQTVQVWLKN